MLLTVVICWAVAVLIAVVGKILLDRTPGEFAEEVRIDATGEEVLSILRQAFADLSPNSRGRGSIDFLNLSTCIKKMEEGEGVKPSLLVFLLSKIEGGEPYAERIKGLGA